MTIKDFNAEMTSEDQLAVISIDIIIEADEFTWSLLEGAEGSLQQF